MVYHFWTSTLPDRLPAFWLLVPVYAARAILHRRLWTFTPLDPLFIIFLVIGILNINLAPFTFGYPILSRPLLGMACVIAIVEYARRKDSTTGVLVVLMHLAFLVGFLALGSTLWNSKSDPLLFIIDRLPEIRGFPGGEGGFNANEIGGAMSWLIPLMAGVAIYARRFPNGLKPAGFAGAFFLLIFMLFLGQSRLALGGVIIALAMLIFLLIPHNIWRYIAYVALAIFTALTVYLALNQSKELGDRDAESAATRFDIWEQGAQAVRDYPLTGLGMNTFRRRSVRPFYPVAGYERRILPHTHNEALQITVDLGVPGALIYLGWHAVLIYMVIRVWWSGDQEARAISLAAGGGLLAHAFFGLADAITLWDRFAFIYWLLVGVVAAQYVLITRRKPNPPPTIEKPVSDHDLKINVD